MTLSSDTIVSYYNRRFTVSGGAAIHRGTRRGCENPGGEINAPTLAFTSADADALGQRRFKHADCRARPVHAS